MRDGSPSRQSFSRVDSRGSPSSFLSKCRESPEKGFSRVFSCSECVFLSRIAFVSFGGHPGAGEKERERENQERRKPPGLVSRVKLENLRAARSGESLGAKSRRDHHRESRGEDTFFCHMAVSDTENVLPQHGAWQPVA